MVDKFKSFIYSLTEYVLSFMFFYLITVAIHEYIHLKVLQYFGGNGVIGIGMWGGGFVNITKYPAQPWMLTPVALSGGLGIAMLFTIKMAMDLKDDYEEAYALIPLILNQLAYGIFEGFFIFNMPKSEFTSIALDIAVITFVAGFLLSIILFVRKWVNIHYPKT